METEEKKRALVVGGSGSIGSAIVKTLAERGYAVEILCRGETPKSDRLGPDYPWPAIHCDVAHEVSMVEAAEKSLPLDAIVYTVGRCPPGGFDAAIATPLLELPTLTFDNEFEDHVVGLLHVAKTFLKHVRAGGHLVVISSAITRLNDEQCPPWLHAGHYATAKAAQDELIRWLRREPLVREQKILVHRIAPAAVDTPFHQGCQRQPPKLLPVEDIAKAVVTAIEGSEVIDRMLLPS